MSQHEVRDFLLAFKQAASESGIDLIPRSETKQTQSELGITNRNLEQILLELSVADYCAGPKVDRDRPGQIWEFGKSITGNDIYIKLKVAEVRGTKIAKCISFHVARFELKYPYK